VRPHVPHVHERPDVPGATSRGPISAQHAGASLVGSGIVALPRLCGPDELAGALGRDIAGARGRQLPGKLGDAREPAAFHGPRGQLAAQLRDVTPELIDE
jgi:hypothetical protein